jgi:hypothetical protein
MRPGDVITGVSARAFTIPADAPDASVVILIGKTPDATTTD